MSFISGIHFIYAFSYDYLFSKCQISWLVFLYSEKVDDLTIDIYVLYLKKYSYKDDTIYNHFLIYLEIVYGVWVARFGSRKVTMWSIPGKIRIS